jgi:acetyl-CoA carboxylase carboxyltransferase component
MTKSKTHQSELERLAALEQQAEIGGGQKAVDRQHQRGKLTARERLNLLFDPGSFVEVNKLAESQSTDFGMQEKKVPGDGVVTGYGTIEGRLVFAYAQDVTVLGGSVGTIHGQKICRIMDEAIKVKAPLVALNDSGGGRLHEGFFASRGVAGMFRCFRPDSTDNRYDGIQCGSGGLFAGVDRFYCHGKRQKPHGDHRARYHQISDRRRYQPGRTRRCQSPQ